MTTIRIVNYIEAQNAHTASPQDSSLPVIRGLRERESSVFAFELSLTTDQINHPANSVRRLAKYAKCENRDSSL